MIRHIKHHGSKFFTKLFMRFVVGGLMGFVFTFIVTAVLTELYNVNYLISFIIPFTLATLFNFIVAVKYIFKVDDNYHTRFIKYAVSVVIFYFGNLAGLKLLVDTFYIHYLVSIVLVTGIIFLIKFLIYDRLVFHRHG